MKPKTKVLLFFVIFLFPYLGFVMYRALTHPEHPFPTWFLYVAPCYLVGGIFLFVLLRKRIMAGGPSLHLAEQNAQRLKAARSLRRLGYMWLLGPVFFFLSGGQKGEPKWAIVLGVAWVGFLIWASFREAKRIEMKVRQNQT